MGRAVEHPTRHASISRRSFVLALAATAILPLASCAPSKIPQKGMKGKRVEVVLPYSAGTGYTWTCETDNNILELQGISTVDLAAEGVAGGPLEDHFVLVGKGAGSVRATFRLSRAWEPTESDETLVCSFSVSNDLTVTFEGFEGKAYKDCVRMS
ncbi:MAG: protease inhibitor I42 family protein [Olsenella sp.]|nr:protease inhibitor I42 family protein [Olsenella sp.]